MPLCEYCGVQQSGTAKFYRKCGNKVMDAEDRNIGNALPVPTEKGVLFN